MVRVYAIYPTGWCLIPEQARLPPFMTLLLPTIGTSTAWVQLQVTAVGTTPP